MRTAQRGFTLIELLVVITIILLVSAVALPVVVVAMGHRSIRESARLMQGALAGARDEAIRTGTPSGIRLLPDPVLNGIGPLSITVKGVQAPNPYAGVIDPGQSLALTRILPIGPAPAYQDGLANIIVDSQGGSSGAYAATLRQVNLYSGVPCLVLEEAVMGPVEAVGSPAPPNPPTSWFWNVRLGDKIQLNNVGGWYTVVGPMIIPPQGVTINKIFYANTEMFVNAGIPGTTPPTLSQGVPAEYLLLVNGRDDNLNGWVDEGWDGVDNDGDNVVNQLIEWEAETWMGAIKTMTNVPYTIRRRPVPLPGAREQALPQNVVVNMTPGRSRVPTTMCNPYDGTIDIMINPDGTILPTSLYSSPASAGMTSAFIHLWLAERGDLASSSTTNTPPVPATPQGEWSLVTILGRTGRVAITESPDLNDPYSSAQRGTQ